MINVFDNIRKAEDTDKLEKVWLQIQSSEYHGCYINHSTFWAYLVPFKFQGKIR